MFSALLRADERRTGSRDFPIRAMMKRPPRACLVPLLCVWLAGMVCPRPLQADEVMRQVQEELRKRHLYFGDIDGQLTPAVSAALRLYQQRKGFSASGQPDEDTLRSLSLVPPAPDLRTVAPLPDTPVLRSDSGRAVEPLPAQPDEAEIEPPAPTPAPSPPPAAPQSLASRDIQDFLQRYLLAGQTNDPAAELRFYADHVSYFDDGVVDRDFIAADVRRYEHRWPERQFSLVGRVEIAGAPDGDPAKIRVRFRYHFSVKGARFSAAGLTDNEYVLSGLRPDELRIVSLKEQRVRP